MPEVHIHPTPSAGSAAADQAYSRGLLERVARGEIDGAIRIWHPSPAVALSRLDELRPGVLRARAAAQAAGVEPVVRMSGGHAVVLGSGSICAAFAEPAHVFEGTQGRYERMVAALLSALAALGVDAEQGELPGEWCPGAWSIRTGAVKLAGLAQRVVKGAAWTDAVVSFDSDANAAALMAEVYEALDLPLDPGTIGAVSELSDRQAEFDDFAQPLLSALLG